MQVLSPLENNIQYLKGVGPKKANLLKKLGILTINDLLTYFPRDWEDRSKLTPIALVHQGEKKLISGRIELYDILPTRSKLKILKAAISDKTGTIYALWFKRSNPRYDVFSQLKKQLLKGKEIFLYGTIKNEYGYKQIQVEDYEIVDTKMLNLLHLGRVVPFYFLTEGLEGKFFRQLIKMVLENYPHYTVDILPENIKRCYSLLPYSQALRAIHFPKNFYEKEKAYQRLVFEEFFLFQLAIALKRQKVKKMLKRQTYTIKRHLLTSFRKNLGFEFTKTQKRVINEIFTDLQSERPMNRLLQGDVGSGKTVVALSAILLATENNCQSVFMAPTEILAEQHYLTFKHFLRNLPVEFALLTGETRKKEREIIFEKLKNGETSILIGTHALIEEGVTFKNLVLVVIDEQHRFGVTQRAKLYEKGLSPDVLVLTATPIPRSLALTLYADLDISLLNELPPGRPKIVTLHLSEMGAYQFVKKEITSGHQAYIVYPLIEESDKLELKAAVSEAENLRKGVFADNRVGIIHGQLPGKEKEKIMSNFRSKKYDILIATTVIEVGIDVPNATVMVIEHADRFGLATLHQLRGRIGRGKNKDENYCILLGKPKTEEAKKRIEIMLSTTNGFRIAEEDLKLRGPGEFFGTAQHGLPEFKIGNLLKDYSLLKQARESAYRVLEKKDEFYREGYQTLQNCLHRRFGPGIKLADIV